MTSMAALAGAGVVSGLVDLFATPTAFKPASGSTFGVITLDASVKELHRVGARVTRHPVEAEKGAALDVSDHVQVEPLTIQIEGIISNWPAVYLGVLQTLGADVAAEAYQEFIEKTLTGQVVTVVTTLMEYPDMVLESVEVTRDADKGAALFFSARATQISIVEMKETAAGTTSPAGATKSRGSVAAKAATGAGAAGNLSLLKAVF